MTEIVALSSQTHQPFSLFSHIHSSREKEYVSVNEITLKALEKTFVRFPDSTYIFDRGYDMNRVFDFMNKHEKQYIVRMTEKRKVFFKGKWFKVTTLRDSRKGKLKSHILLTANRQNAGLPA